MATIFEMTGDEREQRVAELKRKMQESANRAQEEGDAADADSAVAATNAEAAAPIASPEDSTTNDVDSNTDAAVAESTEETDAPVSEPAAEATPVATTNGSVATPSATAIPAAVVEDEYDEQAAMTRREFLMYTWGAALGLLTVESALMSYFFMYPRFRVGEFGGKFFLSQSDMPSMEAAPVGETAGKFWLVNTDDGPKALYMVCTHLGCLYKWEASNGRFECPCHGSKFDKAGYFIEGPAPRSLDEFELTEENGQVIVDTGSKIVGGPAAESPARAVTA